MLVISRKKQKICAQKMYDKSTQLINDISFMLVTSTMNLTLKNSLEHFTFVLYKIKKYQQSRRCEWKLNLCQRHEWMFSEKQEKKTNFVCCFKNKWTLVRRKTKYILSNFFSTWEDHAFYFRSKIRNKGKHFSCVILREFLT